MRCPSLHGRTASQPTVISCLYPIMTRKSSKRRHRNRQKPRRPNPRLRRHLNLRRPRRPNLRLRRHLNLRRPQLLNLRRRRRLNLRLLRLLNLRIHLLLNPRRPRHPNPRRRRRLNLQLPRHPNLRRHRRRFLQLHRSRLLFQPQRRLQRLSPRLLWRLPLFRQQHQRIPGVTGRPQRLVQPGGRRLFRQLRQHPRPSQRLRQRPRLFRRLRPGRPGVRLHSLPRRRPAGPPRHRRLIPTIGQQPFRGGREPRLPCPLTG